jgi:hypothetical protein
MEVVARQLALPKSYGTPHRVLAWKEVEQKLVQSRTYWLATTRRDGRPHTVPVDGIWLEDALYFGGDPATVHMRNLRSDPRAVLHTESGESPGPDPGADQPVEDQPTGGAEAAGGTDQQRSDCGSHVRATAFDDAGRRLRRASQIPASDATAPTITVARAYPAARPGWAAANVAVSKARAL